MNAAVARIIIRYLVAALTTWGFLHPEIGQTIVADPDVAFVLQTLIGLTVAAANEWWYVADRKAGKTT